MLIYSARKHLCFEGWRGEPRLGTLAVMLMFSLLNWMLGAVASEGVHNFQKELSERKKTGKVILSISLLLLGNRLRGLSYYPNFIKN